MTRFRSLALGALHIEDERSLRGVPLVSRLRDVLVRDRYTFRVSAGDAPIDWNRALFLNLTFWAPREGGDVLASPRIPADVVAHVAWHHLAGQALGPAATTAEGLLLGESIASAFDLYLVGHLLAQAPRAGFLRSQVPAIAEVARAAGLEESGFAALLTDIAGDPDAAFSGLRSLLYTVSTRLLRARGITEASRVLERLREHRFHPLLHHYNVSNWILFARAHGAPGSSTLASRVAAIDRALRRAPSALAWLDAQWVAKRELPARRRR